MTIKNAYNGFISLQREFSNSYRFLDITIEFPYGSTSECQKFLRGEDKIKPPRAASALANENAKAIVKLTKRAGAPGFIFNLNFMQSVAFVIGVVLFVAIVVCLCPPVAIAYWKAYQLTKINRKWTAAGIEKLMPALQETEQAQEQNSQEFPLVQSRGTL